MTWDLSEIPWDYPLIIKPFLLIFSFALLWLYFYFHHHYVLVFKLKSSLSFLGIFSWPKRQNRRSGRSSISN